MTTTTEFVSLPIRALSAAAATMAITTGGFAAVHHPAAVLPATAVTSVGYCAPTAPTIGYRTAGNRLMLRPAALKSCLPGQQ